jgi:hypothetical protein
MDLDLSRSTGFLPSIPESACNPNVISFGRRLCANPEGESAGPALTAKELSIPGAAYMLLYRQLLG